MKFKKTIGGFVILISLFAILSASVGIFSRGGGESYDYVSIRGETVKIYGQGLYQHMSAEVAIQGIAQDFITLFIAVPFLVIAFLLSKNGSSVKGKIVLAGVLAYFAVTYLFYLMMGMYNQMYLCYVLLLGLSFYSFIMVAISLRGIKVDTLFSINTPFKVIGATLIFISFCLGLLWLSIIFPPLLTKNIFPSELEHYTTLVVQGLDLAILLPAASISGVLFIKKKPLGLASTPVYFIFLVLLMIALTAKVIAMAISGYNVFPVIFVIPAFIVITIILTVVIFKNINNFSGNESPLR